MHAASYLIWFNVVYTCIRSTSIGPIISCRRWRHAQASLSSWWRHWHV